MPEIIGDQIVLPYSSVVLSMAVYVLISFLGFPPVSAGGRF